ncbi:TPA: hypothetical protein VLQ55_000447 [Streptococcus pyogenes]|uniref:hypothetical protein n=1 Tax=Streptococcus pyogenes TaxID=1314 RepID=UPI0010A1664D|nr:hypothetical protein [Streptococcus pyogenes]VHF26124.1 Uncharacterised protein [Streptococcus pyogenes]HER6475366.1 hypothetical protein [Streptococcus pyogenes]HER6477133.1 hypothetical protein [Streptococcus pyogenes]HER6480605.1 hypothetical protein [Streptococcus pyogenes]HER6484088.1 hypothetical protein [Streptococcus pyogenes]
MTDRANDILTDYEGLCGQLMDILNVLDLAAQEYSKETTSAIINTSCSALKCLISDHDKTTHKYRKEL